jgi:hypothetical protein
MKALASQFVARCEMLSNPPPPPSLSLICKELAAARARVRYFGWESMGRMQQFNHPMQFVDGKPGSFDKTNLFR